MIYVIGGFGILLFGPASAFVPITEVTSAVALAIGSTRPARAAHAVPEPVDSGLGSSD